MPASNFQPWEFKPLKLSKKETEKPMNAVHDFFDYANLPQVRGILWEWLKVTVAGNYNKSLSRHQRADLLYFYEQLEKLIEAAHLLHTNKK